MFGPLIDRFELPSSMLIRECGNSEVSEGLGGVCEGVCWSKGADWIDERLAAAKAASHCFLLGDGLRPPGAVRSPLPRIF